MRDDQAADEVVERIVAGAGIVDSRRRDELRRELRAHFEDAGVTPDRVREAVARFGDVTRVAESLRHVYRREHAVIRWVRDCRQDFVFGLRMLRRSPGISALAILCLTLAIGANTAVFSWIEGTMLRPYALVAGQDRLLVVAGTLRGSPGSEAMSWPDFVDLRRNATLIQAFIAEKIVGTTLNFGGERADRAPGSVVSANYFDALGVRPALGRGFEPAEEVGRNTHPVVVISYQLWHDRFQSDPAVIGRTQVLNGVPHTIVGVAPEGFYGTFVGYAFQFWVPLSMQEMFDPGGYKLEDRNARWIEGFVLPKPGVTRGQAEQELSALAGRFEADYPLSNRDRSVRLLPLWQSPFNGMVLVVPTLGTALVVVAAVLLIACANVGNLLLLRSFARRREIATRLALGAGRGRLVRQMLTEGCVLSLGAAAGGLGVAYLCRNALVLLFGPRGGLTLRFPASLDWEVLSLSAAVCVASALLFGLAPAILGSKVDLVDALKSESGNVMGRSGKTWARSGLVVLQVALSFVLLVGADLLIQSDSRMRATDPGFAADRVVVTSVDLVAAGYDPPRIKAFEDQLIDRLQARPGVESATFVRVAPFSYRTYSSARVAVDGYDTQPDALPAVDYDEVGPAYFSTMGIPLRSGREFTRADKESADPVAVVNETMAAEYWRGADPVGRRFVVNGRPTRVVGVAALSKYRSLTEPPRSFFYVPLRQGPTGVGLLIRTAGRPEALAQAVASDVHALNPNLAPSEVISMREQITRMSASLVVAVTLLMAFAGVALLLAAIGLYGVMSSLVSQSRRELGLRRALGAGNGDVLRLVMSRGAALTAGGVAAGVAAAFGLTRLMGYLLFEVSPRDPGAFGSALAVIGATAAVACVVPAFRATRIDPLRALRE
jgi:predicted permease